MGKRFIFLLKEKITTAFLCPVLENGNQIIILQVRDCNMLIIVLVM